MTDTSYPFPNQRFLFDFIDSSPIPTLWRERDDFEFIDARVAYCDYDIEGGCGEFVGASYDGMSLTCPGCDRDIETWTTGPTLACRFPISVEPGIAPEDAAIKLADLPICLVRLNSRWWLALTANGAEFQWDIAAAYVRLGFYPPTWLDLQPKLAAGRLTDVAEIHRVARVYVDACSLHRTDLAACPSIAV